MNTTIIYLAMVVFEVVAGLVALIRGNDDVLRQCSTMAMLWLIAAGVWRERK